MRENNGNVTEVVFNAEGDPICERCGCHLSQSVYPWCDDCVQAMSDEAADHYYIGDANEFDDSEPSDWLQPF